MKKLKVGVLGATGMVGQRFVSLLDGHPWFEVAVLAASSRSAGKSYGEAVQGKSFFESGIPVSVKAIIVRSVVDDIDEIVRETSLVFCALNMSKDETRRIEEEYASKGIPVISNNSAHRWTEDVPVIVPEINPGHVRLVDVQRKKRGWGKGLIVVKPNCSIQSYVPIIKALEKYSVEEVVVTTAQAISGAGKTFSSFPEIHDNVLPFISGEEEKSEREPMKILGEIKGDGLVLAGKPAISATCFRVPVSDGHMASVNIRLGKNISREEFIDAVNNYDNPVAGLGLPSAPKQFIKYFEDDSRPQTRLDRDYAGGMGITMGRLRKDSLLGWKFVALSHNTVRGAAGGAILTAELLKAKGYI